MITTQRGWKVILAAIFGGFALGVIARLWMRWISTDPEFSWGGTLGIIIAFTIFSTTQATIYVLRRRVITRRLTSVIRVVGTFFTLPLFTAAGAVMFPTVILASIAIWRKQMDKKVRTSLLIISFVIPIIQIKEIGTDFGWNFITLGRTLLFILIYSVVVLLLKPTLTPYVGNAAKVVLTKRLKLILVAIFTIVVAFFVLKVFVMSSN